MATNYLNGSNRLGIRSIHEAAIRFRKLSQERCNFFGNLGLFGVCSLLNRKRALVPSPFYVAVNVSYFTVRFSKLGQRHVN